jgi:hypothetical protein
MGRPWRGFCARYAEQSLPISSIRALTVADAQLAEQARNRDHDSSDKCGQAKKQQKVPQEHRHNAPLTSLVQGHLDTPSIALSPIPDTGAITKYFALALVAARPEPRVTCASYPEISASESSKSKIE